MKTHRGLKMALLAIVLLLFIVLAGAWGMFGTQIKAAGTVEKLEENLYTFKYQGDYGLDELMEQGGASDNGQLAAYITSFLSHGFYTPEAEDPTPDFGCSTLTVSSPEGGVLFGRNYDWEPCKAMIVRCDPEKGFASVSTACLDFLGLGEDWTPDGGMMDRIMALAAVYIPLDGVNEKGLCVADLMAGDQEETHQESDKPDVTTTLAIRLLLDRAATVEEAVALLEGIDMNSVIGAAHHLAIADAAGNSVVVEYVGGKMIVTPTPVVTNHYLAEEKQGVGSEQSHRRFDTLTGLYEATGGVMPAEALRDALASVAQSRFPHESGDYEGTQWSLVLDPSGGGYQLYWRENYEKAYTVTIPDLTILTRNGVTETVSRSDYEGWLADTLEDAAELEIPYQAMTEENIKACGAR